MRVALAHSWRERETDRQTDRQREFAFVCTWSSVRTCVWCRSKRVNLFVKLISCNLLVLYVGLFIFYYSFLLSCNFNIIYKCVCAERGGVGYACRCMSEWVCVCVCVRARAFLALLNSYSAVLQVGFYIMKWNVIYKCVCVCVELLFCLS